VKKGTVAKNTYEAAGAALTRVGEVLGLGLDDPVAFQARVRDRRAVALGIDCKWVDECITRRSEARKNKDFQAADAVRDELAQKGIEMLDTPSGTTWRIA